MTEKKEKYHHGDLRNSLIEAGIKLVAEKGPKDFSLREVAKVAGVSHSAPYRHFQDKNELMAAIAESGFRELAGETAGARTKFAGNPEKQLIEAGIAYVKLAVKHPEKTALMFGGIIECKPELDLAGQEAYLELVKIIKNGIDAGIYKDKSADELTLTAWSVVHGLAMLISGKQLPEQLTDTDEKLENLVSTVCRNLQAGITR